MGEGGSSRSEHGRGIEWGNPWECNTMMFWREVPELGGVLPIMRVTLAQTWLSISLVTRGTCLRTESMNLIEC